MTVMTTDVAWTQFTRSCRREQNVLLEQRFQPTIPRLLRRDTTVGMKLVLYPDFLVIILVTGNIGGMETTGRIRKMEVAKTDSFTEIKSLNIYHSTQILLTALIFPK